MYNRTGFMTVLIAATSAAQADEASDARDEARIARLIVQLGDDSYRMREAAGAELFAIGEPALPPLRIANRTSRDLEVRSRAARLVRRIMITACQSRSLSMNFAYLQAGRFWMGSNTKEKDRRDDESQHAVRITRPFLIAALEVTQDEYDVVMNARPSWFSPTGEGRNKVAKFKTGSFPVDSVTWFDAIAFCNRLSQRDGLAPYYSVAEVRREGKSIVAARVKIVGELGYRLPTETEWEYACRAGTTTPYHFGKGRGGGNFQYMSSIGYGRSSHKLGRPTRVASYKPNAWGLFDMHGNVAEWCWDWYDKSYYAKSPATDPGGPSGGDHRVLRGGSFLVKQSSCRSATRFWSVPGEGTYYIGFRIARHASHYMIPARP